MVVTLFRPNEKKFSQVGWRVRLMLEEKNIRFETRLIVLSQKEHKEEDIVRLNPRGELPILQDEYYALHEEASMVQYIEENYPEPPLMPQREDRKNRAEVLVIFHESIGVFANNCRNVISFLSNEDTPSTSSAQNAFKEKVKECKMIVSIELSRWEKLLVSHGEQFLTGKEISVVDCGLDLVSKSYQSKIMLVEISDNFED
ncbi:glutathione S-transferase [Acrasis kona]|uniref:Glutathione S-transferase n=1 Tax=Acrasis kona TaxID=1008807 RepID=A0AAW2ZM89_9EUKA